MAEYERERNRLLQIIINRHSEFSKPGETSSLERITKLRQAMDEYLNYTVHKRG